MNGTKSLYDSISKNKLKLFQHKNDVAVSKKSQEISSLKSDCCLYGNLYIACQAIKGDLGEFFVHENHYIPTCNFRILKALEMQQQIRFSGLLKGNSQAKSSSSNCRVFCY